MCQEHLQHNIFIPPWLRNNVTLSCSEQKGLHHNIPQTWCILPFCHLVLILSERVTQLFWGIRILFSKINISTIPNYSLRDRALLRVRFKFWFYCDRSARCSLSSVQMARCRRDFVIFIVPPHRGPPVKLTKKLKYARIYILHFHGPHKATPPSLSLDNHHRKESNKTHSWNMVGKESRLNFPISGNLEHYSSHVLHTIEPSVFLI